MYQKGYTKYSDLLKEYLLIIQKNIWQCGNIGLILNFLIMYYS